MSAELRRNPLQEPAENENTNKNENNEELQSELLRDLPGWLQEFREKLVDESVPGDSLETRRMNIETLPVLLMKYQWSREQKWNGALVSTAFIFTSRNTQIVIYA